MSRSFRLAHLLEGDSIVRESLPVSQFDIAVAAFGVEQVDERCRPLAISKLADFARLLRLLEITGTIEIDDALIGFRLFIRKLHILQDGFFSSLGIVVRLRCREASAEDFSLV